MLREITNNSQDLLGKEICELNIRDFSELVNNKCKNSEYDRETIVEILGKLKDLAKVKKRYLTMKIGNISYYNEAWSLCSEFPDVFLNRALLFEVDLKNAYSEVFKVVNGNKNTKIILTGKKALYVSSILDALEKAISISYKGRFFSELCKERNMTFEEFRLTDEFDILNEEYEKVSQRSLGLVEDIIEMLDEYQCYAILNKEKEYKLKYFDYEAEVEGIA